VNIFFLSTPRFISGGGSLQIFRKFNFLFEAFNIEQQVFARLIPLIFIL